MQRCPDVPLPFHLLLLFQGDTEVLTSHPRDVISPWTFLEHLTWETFRRHPLMWRSSSSTCHPNDQNHPVSKAEPTTIWRKLISTAYIHNLIFFQSPPRACKHRLGWECRSASHLLLTPHRSICRSPAPLSPHSSIRVLNSGQQPIPDLEWALRPFPTENRGLEL